MSSNEDNDISIPADQMNDFFFMNEDEEKEKYGQTTKVPESLISGNIQKQVKVNQVSFENINLDFEKIYFLSRFFIGK